MLKIFALIQCNVCNGVLSQIAAAEKTDESLSEEIYNLQLAAEQHGWQSRRCSTEHVCGDCLHGE